MDGAIVRGGPLSTQFRYVTIADIRREEIDETRLPDDRADYLIQLCSNWVNWLTKQWFVPIRLRQRVDGRNCSVAHLPTFVPILELYNLILEKEGLFTFPFPQIAYQVRERFVQLLSAQSQLPGQPEFVVLDGVFGWLEDTFAPVRTTITSGVTFGDTTISVADASRINVGEVVLVGSDPEPESGPVIVSSKSGNDLIVDPIRFEASAGAPAVKYGRIPRLIQWATLLLIKDKMVPLGIRGTDEDEEGPRWWADRLQSESVEGYSYSLAAIPVPYGHGGGAYTTGNPEVDDILQQFCSGAQMLYVGAVR